MSRLDVLVGQELCRIERVHDYHQLHFTSYLLNVFNSMAVERKQETEIDSQLVDAIHETDMEVQIVLTSDTTITVDLSAAGWNGPEALALYLGDECIAVWT